MKLNLSFLEVFAALICIVQGYDRNGTSVNQKSEVLSRRKRFIIFPEGSSFQVVFCNTYPAITTIGDIFLWGATAALAFELPQDPYSPFNHHADPQHRRTDSKMIYYTSEEGKIIYGRPYSKRKLIVNPAFAKRSVDSHTEIRKEAERIEIDRKQMHDSQNKREFLNGAQSRRSVEFHRSARAALYQKIETMLNGLGTDGKQCLLKTLCVVGKTKHPPQGSFLQEILRVTFTLPEGLSNNDLDHYDAAFSAKESCDELYPDCEEPLTEPVLRSCMN